MIICDLDVIRIIAIPDEANTPLIVDFYTVLSFSITVQFFYVIGWWIS